MDLRRDPELRSNVSDRLASLDQIEDLASGLDRYLLGTMSSSSVPEIQLSRSRDDRGRPCPPHLLTWLIATVGHT